MENYGAQETINPQVEAQIMKKKLLEKQQQTQLTQQPQLTGTTNNPTVAQATTEAIAGGADPTALASAKSFLGDQAYIGYCEAFVEQIEGSGVKYPSAIDAWNSQAESGKAVEGLSGIQPGDAIYFTPNAGNGYYGHTGVYSGTDQNGEPSFISATNTGVQQAPLGAWTQSTGQQVLGYVPTQ